MIKSIALITIATAAMLWNVGCASVESASTGQTFDGSKIASSEQIDPALPAVAAGPPSPAWGNASRPYSY